jgi:hypothetical protein
MECSIDTDVLYIVTQWKMAHLRDAPRSKRGGSMAQAVCCFHCQSHISPKTSLEPLGVGFVSDSALDRGGSWSIGGGPEDNRSLYPARDSFPSSNPHDRFLGGVGIGWGAVGLYGDTERNSLLFSSPIGCALRLVSHVAIGAVAQRCVGFRKMRGFLKRFRILGRQPTATHTTSFGSTPQPVLTAQRKP